jgi:hypothetical protein
MPKTYRAHNASVLQPIDNAWVDNGYSDDASPLGEI